MPIVHTSKGYKAYAGSPTTFKSKKKAEKQLTAIKINQMKQKRK
jgi:hypothetical protein